MKSTYICFKLLTVIKDNPGLSIDEIISLTCKSAGTKAIEYIKATMLTYINAQQIRLTPDLKLYEITTKEYFELNPDTRTKI